MRAQAPRRLLLARARRPCARARAPARALGPGQGAGGPIDMMKHGGSGRLVGSKTEQETEQQTEQER